MKSKFLGSLLHIADPTLPIGSFTLSNGLETYVQHGKVNDTASAQLFIKNMLKYNIKYNDASFVKLAFEASEREDLSTLLKLDEECTALKTPMEIRESSKKLGIRFMKIFSRHQPYELARKFQEKINQKQADAHYAIVFGMYAQLMEIPISETLYAFYYNACIGMITNAVKIIPLGQLDGQDMMFHFQGLLLQLTEETQTVERDLVGLCNIGFDIRCMEHERLYSRLYMS